MYSLTIVCIFFLRPLNSLKEWVKHQEQANEQVTANSVTFNIYKMRHSKYVSLK